MRSQISDQLAEFVHDWTTYFFYNMKVENDGFLIPISFLLILKVQLI